jgi:NADPH:quinone reductase-like Zn-dependent oxidoreductase
MKALRLTGQTGAEGLVYESAPSPVPGTGDVVIAVHAASYTPGELQWPMTQVDRSGHDRTPAIPCHEVSGVVTELGFGATGFEVGDEVYGLIDWYRDGAAAESVAVEARNLAARPASIDHVAASALPLAGLTAWQALFRHGKLSSGETVLVLGAGGGVGNLAAQLAQHAGAEVIPAGRSRDRGAVAETGEASFLDLDRMSASTPGDVSLVIDTIGGQIGGRIADGLGPGTRFVSIVEPSISQTVGSRGVFFVVEPDKVTLTEIARLVDAGQLRSPLRSSSDLSAAAELISAKETGRVSGKISLQVV